MSLSSIDLPASILFCRLCQSLYRHPRTLPCLHSFCHDCLRQIAPTQPKEGQAALSCPVCGWMAPLTSAGVAGLTSNEFLARMCQEYVGEVQKTLASTKPMSPGVSAAGSRGPASPTSVIAGRAPPGLTVSSPSSGYTAHSYSSSSPGGSNMSPRQHMAFDYSFHGRPVTFVTSSFASPPQGSQPSTTHASEHVLHTSLSPKLHSSSTSSSSSDVVLQAARRLSAENISRVAIQRRLSSTPRDVLRTWECLQHKLNSLQAAALQVTYSLDNVNMAEANWHQRKQDLRRDVQRRSAQLQFFIKRQERLLLAALDSRQTDEGFQASADRARAELRDNLKSLMHEIDIMRSVLDLAADTELLSLSSLLLESPVCQTPVTMTTPELRLVVPDDVSLEDMVSKDFGCLTSALVTQTVFTPEEIDFTSLADELHEEDDAFAYEPPPTANSTDISASNTITKGDNFEDIAYIDDDEEEVVVEETFEIIDGKMQIVSKKSVPVSTKSADKQAQREPSWKQSHFMKEAPEAKDSDSRGRGRERQSLARTDRTIIQKTTHAGQERAGGGQKVPGDTADTKTEPDKSETAAAADKFHSLRESLRQRRRELLLSGSVLSRPFQPRSVNDVIGQERRVQSLDRTSALRDQSRRSQSPTSPQRRAVQNVAAAVVQSPTLSFTTVHSPAVQLDNSSTETRRLSTNGAAVADGIDTGPVSPTSPVSPTEHTSRPARRAISAASDRTSKMEYLRETWRRRKELLIQNEAFITAPPVLGPDVGGGELGGGGEVGVESGDVTSAPYAGEENEAPAGGSKSGKVKQSLRSRFSNLKQVLRKNGKSEDGKPAEKPIEVIEDNNITGKDSVKTSSASATAENQESVEERVLHTVDSILQNRMLSSLPPDTSGTQQLPASSTDKPSMVVKPHPRDPSPGPAPSLLISPKLEPVEEGKVTAPTVRKTGLRVTSPPNTDISKERIQQVRANMRRKKERWRSLSLT